MIMKRVTCFRALHGLRHPDTVVVTTMGSVAPWSRLSNASLDFPGAGSAMGHAADFAMGLALARPERKIWVFNGDGSMLMSLGTLVTVAQTPPPNLAVFIIENGTFEVTGNQPIPGAGIVSFDQIALGAGITEVHTFDSVSAIEDRLPDILQRPGPHFLRLLIEAGNEPPPKLDCPLKIPAARLRRALA